MAVQLQRSEHRYFGVITLHVNCDIEHQPASLDHGHT